MPRHPGRVLWGTGGDLLLTLHGEVDGGHVWGFWGGPAFDGDVRLIR